MSVASSIITTRIDCLRHGDVEGGPCFRGRSDDPLSTIGWQKMQQRCQGRQWDAVVSSPLVRCRAFAQALANDQRLPLAIDADWMEIDFGAWEGLTATQIDASHPGAVRRFYADPSLFTPPDAESHQTFSQRICRGWERLLTQQAGRHVLLVTHAGPIRALFSQVLAIPVSHALHIDIPHACLTRFSCFAEGDNRFVRLDFHNPA